MIWATAKMMMALGGVLLLLFLAIRFVRRAGQGRGETGSDAGIRLLASRPIAPQKYVTLVEIGGEVLALGVCDAQITLLTRIENKEFIDRLVTSRLRKPDPLAFLQPLSAGGPGLKAMMGIRPFKGFRFRSWFHGK
jgi:flagellar biosynthetic protein FliO